MGRNIPAQPIAFRWQADGGVLVDAWPAGVRVYLPALECYPSWLVAFDGAELTIQALNGYAVYRVHGEPFAHGRIQEFTLRRSRIERPGATSQEGVA